MIHTLAYAIYEPRFSGFHRVDHTLDGSLAPFSLRVWKQKSLRAAKKYPVLMTTTAWGQRLDACSTIKHAQTADYGSDADILNSSSLVFHVPGSALVDWVDCKGPLFQAHATARQSRKY